jgi:hypothetical protein
MFILSFEQIARTLEGVHWAIPSSRPTLILLVMPKWPLKPESCFAADIRRGAFACKAVKPESAGPQH